MEVGQGQNWGCSAKGKKNINTLWLKRSLRKIGKNTKVQRDIVLAYNSIYKTVM
jgi:hypothetical protein